MVVRVIASTWPILMEEEISPEQQSTTRGWTSSAACIIKCAGNGDVCTISAHKPTCETVPRNPYDFDKQPINP